MLEERGPYVFTEQHIKMDPIGNDNGTVTYKQGIMWHFVPDLSIGKSVIDFQDYWIFV